MFPTLAQPVHLDIRAAMERAMAETIPADKHVAVISAITTVNGETHTQVGFAAKVGEHWTLADEFAWGKSAGLSNQFLVVGAW